MRLLLAHIMITHKLLCSLRRLDIVRALFSPHYKREGREEGLGTS